MQTNGTKLNATGITASFAIVAAVMLFACTLLSGCTPAAYTVGGGYNPSTGGITGTVGVEIKDAEIIRAIESNGESEITTRGGDRAVCFGNNYPGTDAELHQCVADAQRDAINLVRIDHFDPKNIRLFINEKCTKVNYEKWSRWALIEGTGGRRALFNSSHGAEDVSGGKVVDVLVTWDMVATGRWDNTTEVAFDFWHGLLRATKAPWMFLNDSCHSGGQTRFNLNGGAVRLVRALEGPEYVQKRIAEAIQKKAPNDAKITGGTVFAVCRADQLASEDSAGGVGTTCYWAARSNLGDDLKVASIIRESNRLLRAGGNSQNMNPIGSIGILWSR